MTEADALQVMFDRAGVRFVVNKHQSRIGSPRGSFIGVIIQPAGRYNDHDLHVVFHFRPDGTLDGFQVNEG